MNILGSLMLVFFITLAEVSGGNAASVIPNGQEPLVHYQCGNRSTASSEITIYIRNSTLNYYAITHVKGNFNINNTADKCESGFTDRSANVTVNLTNCQQDTVYLYIMKKPAYKDLEQSKKVPIIAGGKYFHEYEISCKVQANGTLYNLTTNFTDKETGEKGKTKENPDLKLALSIKNPSNNPSTIFIGDKVTLIVTDTTDVQNYLKFTDCVASNAKHGDISSITLIKNGTAIEKDIISSVHNSSTLGNNSVEFYAFRFATSSEVRISCSIRACPTMDCTAPTTTTSTTTTTTSPKIATAKGRRRRSVNNGLNSDSKTVSVTFEVHDKNESSGGIKVGHVSPLLLAAIVFGWMKLL